MSRRSFKVLYALDFETCDNRGAIIKHIHKRYGIKKDTIRQQLRRGVCKWPQRENGKGDSYHPLFHIWDQMIRRCFRKNHPSYPNYGGRGITVDPVWCDFDQFVADMGDMPDGRLSLDRIDNNGNYSPWNCRWATARQQSLNKRTNNKEKYINQTRGKWRASVKICGKQLHTPTQVDIEQAIIDRDNLLRLYNDFIE